MTAAGWIALSEVAFGILDRALEMAESTDLTPEEREALKATLDARIEASYAKARGWRRLTPADQTPAAS